MTIVVIVANTSRATTRAISAASDGKESANKSGNYLSAGNFILLFCQKGGWAMCLTSPQDLRHL